MAYVFDLDDTLTSKNCLEVGSRLEKRVHAFLDHLIEGNARVFVVTSRAGTWRDEDVILTYGLGRGTVKRLVRAVGARTLKKALELNANPATKWLYYINDGPRRLDEIERLSKFVRAYPDSPINHGGVIKMFQLMDIQEQTGLSFRDIHFFDDADHNYEAWMALGGIKVRLRSGRSTKLRHMNFYWGEGECVFRKAHVWEKLDLSMV